MYYAVIEALSKSKHCNMVNILRGYFFPLRNRIYPACQGTLSPAIRDIRPSPVYILCIYMFIYICHSLPFLPEVCSPHQSPRTVKALAGPMFPVQIQYAVLIRFIFFPIDIICNPQITIYIYIYIYI